MKDEDLSVLANYISVERAQKVWNRYYEEVTKKTYNRWFNDKTRPTKSQLNAGFHGGFTEDFGGRKVHYYMLKRKYYSFKKTTDRVYGSYYAPNKQRAFDIANEAERLMNVNVASNVTVANGVGYIEIQIPISDERDGSDGKGTFLGFNKGNDPKQSNSPTKKISESGRIDTITRTVINGISEWANKEGYNVKIEATYEGDD